MGETLEITVETFNPDRCRFFLIRLRLRFNTNMKGLVLLLFAVGGAISSPIENEFTAMENPDLFEGDIVGMQKGEDRNAVVEPYRRWPKGRIPYDIDVTLKSKADHIRSVMQHIEDKTCVRFVPKTANDSGYANIFAGRGCYSRVGKSIGVQPLSLGPGCHSFGATLHELGHTIGFYHEHSRSDRDDYINIHWENIRKGYADQFTKLKKRENALYDAFDYNSIMLYGETVFSKSHYEGLKTMTAKKEGVVLKDITDKKGLSDSDIYRIKKMYDCP